MILMTERAINKSMKKRKIILQILLFQFLMFSCGGKSDCEKLPFIIIADNPDTVRVGDEYMAKMYLSDTCFFRIKETNSLISPIMFVNDVKIEVDNDNIGNVSFHIEQDTTETDRFTDAYWTGEVVFPHPKGGDIILSKRTDFVIKNFE